ncbi:MAG: ferritin-like domain-containing protein [Burkholderiales bacterium]|nr:MAG: ferritin-like domain-containing protein [Burkholderiales bacterium]
MEREAVSRYNELADMMEVHNNAEVAEMFRKMAGYEAHHVARILADMGWSEDTAASPKVSAWVALEAPESVPIDEMHYLMQPYHALELALAAEERAQAFFEEIVRQSPSDAVREAAEEMRDEEIEHVALIHAWMAKVPHPDPNWSHDPDPPRLVD